MTKQLLKIGIVVMVSLGFGGCSERPVVADAKVIVHDSLWDQEAWVQAQAEDALAVLGPLEGWWVDVPELQWPRDKEKIIRGAETQICRSGQRGRMPGRLILDISNDTLGDPIEAGQRLWKQWESQGWAVSYVIAPAEQPPGWVDIRADRADGAMLGFGASPLYAVVSVDSSCSDDISVMERYWAPPG